MALESLTLFELHLENSRIGPSFGGDDEEEAPTEDASEGGRGRGLTLGVLLLVAIAAAAGARRYRGGEAEDSEQISIEHAAEQ